MEYHDSSLRQLVDDKVNPQQPYQGGSETQERERHEEPVALDDNDKPVNPSKRGQLQIS
jgi:hypothetical protein